MKVKEMFSFQQEVSGKAVRLIADGCQQLKKFSLYNETGVVVDDDDDDDADDDDVIYFINRLGGQLISLTLCVPGLTDVAYTSLKNCAR